MNADRWSLIERLLIILTQCAQSVRKEMDREIILDNFNVKLAVQTGNAAKIVLFLDWAKKAPEYQFRTADHEDCYNALHHAVNNGYLCVELKFEASGPFLKLREEDIAGNPYA